MKPEYLREVVKEKLDDIVCNLNNALGGRNTSDLENILNKLVKSGLPHWYYQLASSGTLPNLDGKTIGSVIEMLFVSILKKFIFSGRDLDININPAKGVDIPELELGIKSPSENYCTSEPFYSAYDRLLGNEYDSIVLLTDYQSAKKNPPLKIKIIDWQYLFGSQIADKNLCSIAKKHRSFLVNWGDMYAKKIFKFLCYVNQNDWRAKYLLKLVDGINKEEDILRILEEAECEFDEKCKELIKNGKDSIDAEEKKALLDIKGIKPLKLGVADACDNWVGERYKDFGRLPNDNEWRRLKTGNLDGQISMSFALQWRYNFSSVFKR